MERYCEPMYKNRVEGTAEQGERAKNRRALLVKAKWRKSGGCAVKECALTWGDLARRGEVKRAVSNKARETNSCGVTYWDGKPVSTWLKRRESGATSTSGSAVSSDADSVGGITSARVALGVLSWVTKVCQYYQNEPLVSGFSVRCCLLVAGPRRYAIHRVRVGGRVQITNISDRRARGMTHSIPRIASAADHLDFIRVNFVHIIPRFLDMLY